MRAPLPLAACLAAGFAVACVAALEAAGAPRGMLAVFAAAVVLAEFLRAGDDEALPGPVDQEAFSAAAAVHLAAAVVLGAWPATLLAFGGALAVGSLRGGVRLRVACRAAVVALATLAAGFGFGLGGRSGLLALPEDLLAAAVLGASYALVRTVLSRLEPGRGTLAPEATAVAGETGLGVLLALAALGTAWNAVPVVPVLLLVERAHARVLATRREVARALETFANIVDERDPSTYRHSLRVAGLVGDLAKALDLPPVEVARLRWAGRLHDLGKVAVDASVLRKRGRLDESEWAAVRRAPRLSARLLQRFHFSAQQAKAVEHHRERADGSGYYGVRGGDIPLASHFLIVADAYDAMTTDRPFRPALSAEEALAELERNRGTQFHPAIASAFVALQRGLDPKRVLSPDELAEVQSAALVSPLPSLPGLRDVRESPELLAVGGTALALVGLASTLGALAAAGAGLASAGLAFAAARRLLAARLARALEAALGSASGDRERTFDLTLASLRRTWNVRWAALLGWDEDGAGISFEAVRGENGPSETALASWVVREAESGRDLLVAPNGEVGPGVYVALPLLRENTALAGFLVLAGDGSPPAHVERALRSSIDSLGLALAERPPADAPSRRRLAAAH